MAAAYERYLEATVAAMELSDPEHPDLEATSKDHGLVAARARVASLTSQGRIARGELIPAITSIEIDDDSASIRDCYRIDMIEHDADTDEVVADRGGVRFDVTARLERTDAGWMVVEFTEGEFCVPADIADAATQAYLDYWDAVYAASDPPEPDHPGLDATSTGTQLEGIRERIEALRDRRYVARRGGSRSNPVAREVHTNDTVVFIRDCRELHPDEGVFDAETGERIGPQAEPGERSLWTARLELVDGSWKVADTDLAEEESGCDPASL